MAFTYLHWCFISILLWYHTSPINNIILDTKLPLVTYRIPTNSDKLSAPCHILSRHNHLRRIPTSSDVFRHFDLLPFFYIPYSASPTFSAFLTNPDLIRPCGYIPVADTFLWLIHSCGWHIPDLVLIVLLFLLLFSYSVDLRPPRYKSLLTS